MYSYVEEWQHEKQNNNSWVRGLWGVGKWKYAVARSESAQQSELFQHTKRENAKPKQET